MPPRPCSIRMASTPFILPSPPPSSTAITMTIAGVACIHAHDRAIGGWLSCAVIVTIVTVVTAGR